MRAELSVAARATGQALAARAPSAYAERPDVRTELDAVSVNLNYARPQQRLFVAANYTFGSVVADRFYRFYGDISGDDHRHLRPGCHDLARIAD